MGRAHREPARLGWQDHCRHRDQHGGQKSLAAAGLNPKVTAVIVNEPAGADSNGDLHGRKAGYPNWPSDNPDVMKTALYFDTVNFASRIKAPVMAGMARAFRTDRVNVVLGHVMIDGAKMGGGEQELTIGMAYAVSPTRLPATASYVALGHLHRHQTIRRAPCPARFAGSLIQLDFGEVDQDKSVVLVEAKAGKPAKAQELPLSAGRRLIDVTGTLDDILAMSETAEDSYLRVRVKTEGPVPGIAERVREVLPNAVVVELDYERDAHDRPEGGVRTLQPRDQFVHYYQHAHEADPDPALMVAFDRVYAESSDGVA